MSLYKKIQGETILLHLFHSHFGCAGPIMAGVFFHYFHIFLCAKTLSAAEAVENVTQGEKLKILQKITPTGKD